MDMVDIEGSTNVAAIGYIAERQLMRVRYHDGRVYEFQPIRQTEYEAVLAAPSKGRAVAMLSRDMPCEENRVLRQQPSRDGGLSSLNVIESEGCCVRHFAKVAATLDNAELWTCPRCGVEYKPQMVGPVRNWVAQIHLSIVRPR